MKTWLSQPGRRIGSLLIALVFAASFMAPLGWSSQPMGEEDPLVIPAAEGADAAKEHLKLLLALQNQVLENFGRSQGIGLNDLNRVRNGLGPEPVVKAGEGNRFIDLIVRHFIYASYGEIFGLKHLNRVKNAIAKQKEEIAKVEPPPVPPSVQPQSSDEGVVPTPVGEIVKPLMNKLIRHEVDVTGDDRFDLGDINRIRNNTPKTADTTISQAVSEMLIALVHAGIDATGDGNSDLNDLNFVRNIPVESQTATPTDPSVIDPPAVDPDLFEENLDFIVGAWETMLTKLLPFGWSYENGEWSYDTSLVINPSGAAYGLAYRVAELAEVARKTGDTEKMVVVAKFYLAYMETQFVTLGSIRAELQDAQNFLAELDPALDHATIKDLAQQGFQLPSFIRDLIDLEGECEIQEVRSIVSNMSNEVNGSPDIPDKNITRQTIAQARAFLEAHPEYDIETTIVETLRRNHSDLPVYFFILSGLYTLDIAWKSVEDWEKRFKGWGPDHLLVIPNRRAIDGYWHIDNMKSTVQLFKPAADLIFEIATWTQAQREANPLLQEFSRKASDLMVHHMMIPAAYLRYDWDHTVFKSPVNLIERLKQTLAFEEMPEDTKRLAGKDWELFWLPAIGSALAAANRLDADLVPLSSREIDQLKEIVEWTLAVADAQTFRHEIELPDGTVVTAGNYQEGMWPDGYFHPLGAKGNFDSPHFAARFGSSVSTILKTIELAGLGHLKPKVEAWVEAVINQFVYVDTHWVTIEGTDEQAPLFTNYIGDNVAGWSGLPEEVGPYGWSGAILTGWAYLASYHPELRRIFERLDEIGRTKFAENPLVYSFAQKYYRNLYRYGRYDREVYADQYLRMLVNYN